MSGVSNLNTAIKETIYQIDCNENNIDDTIEDQKKKINHKSSSNQRKYPPKNASGNTNSTTI